MEARDYFLVDKCDKADAAGLEIAWVCFVTTGDDFTATGAGLAAI